MRTRALASMQLASDKESGEQLGGGGSEQSL